MGLGRQLVQMQHCKWKKSPFCFCCDGYCCGHCSKKKKKQPSLQPKVVLGLPVTSYSNLTWTQQKAQLDIAQKVLLLLIETHMVTQPCSASLYRRLGTGLTCYSHFQTEIHPLWGKENSSFRNSVLQYHGSGCLLSEHNIGNTCSVRHRIWAHVAVLLGLIPLCATILCPYSAFVFYFIFLQRTEWSGVIEE